MPLLYLAGLGLGDKKLVAPFVVDPPLTLPESPREGNPWGTHRHQPKPTQTARPLGFSASLFRNSFKVTIDLPLCQGENFTPGLYCVSLSLLNRMCGNLVKSIKCAWFHLVQILGGPAAIAFDKHCRK